MRYETFNYIAETVKHQSMRKAAEALYITQPALSEAINNVEKELGYKLFERSYNGVALTQEGELALPIIEEILNSTEKLKKIPTENSEGINFSLQGTLNINAVQYFVTNHLAPYSIAFNNVYPNVLLNIGAYGAEEIIRNCMNGACDLGFVSFLNTMELSLSDELIVRKLFLLPLYVVLNEDSPLAKGKSISLKKIPKNVKLIVVGSGYYRSEQWDQEIFKNVEPIQIAQYSNDFDYVMNNIRGNKNLFCLVPVSDELEKKYKFAKQGLKLMPLKDELDVQFYSVYHKDKENCECLKEFLDFADRVILKRKYKTH